MIKQPRSPLSPSNTAPRTTQTRQHRNLKDADRRRTITLQISVWRPDKTAKAAPKGGFLVPVRTKFDTWPLSNNIHMIVTGVEK